VNRIGRPWEKAKEADQRPHEEVWRPPRKSGRDLVLPIPPPKLPAVLAGGEGEAGARMSCRLVFLAFASATPTERGGAIHR